MRDFLTILNVKIDKLDLDGATARIRSLLGDDNSSLVVTPNSEMIAMAAEDSELAEILNSAALATADGAGVVLASMIMGDKLPERVAGFDLINHLFSDLEQEDYNFYFLGSKPGIVDRAVVNLKQKYKNLNIAGYHHGYLDKELQEEIIAEINAKEIDLLLVGMGVPLQERFLANNLAKLKVKVAITVGGSFDVLAGEVNRAPLWMQKVGLEWFYRLIQEPSRFARMLALPKFIYLVTKKRFLKN
ncbi:WecB/TagA/CpsF family glycosyltransferase [Halanaerobium hydrogeniformans]|uniref:N-acetylglucosaminyldiphosphoundecaprenol N-acetyl-beta-D-mannosaminyltransferase n=1 Tax=Halanaerobium hydrogeniformans TaxID=656519 RepID=E4RPR4_HALHG|nr:WecB/TagA/CpsF family glycosyltransferase [Halanaerobium hydrogeniformans]ADQ13948.1 glycosyl transferase, WecB/TagA/CpsF family [Halanaerobium hydrogeniformans]